MAPPAIPSPTPSPKPGVAPSGKRIDYSVAFSRVVSENGEWQAEFVVALPESPPADARFSIVGESGDARIQSGYYDSDQRLYTFRVGIPRSVSGVIKVKVPSGPNRHVWRKFAWTTPTGSVPVLRPSGDTAMEFSALHGAVASTVVAPPQPKPIPSPSPKPVVTSTPTPSPSPTPHPTPSPTPRPTPTPSPSPRPTPKPIPTKSAEELAREEAARREAAKKFGEFVSVVSDKVEDILTPRPTPQPKVTPSLQPTLAPRPVVAATPSPRQREIARLQESRNEMVAVYQVVQSTIANLNESLEQVDLKIGRPDDLVSAGERIDLWRRYGGLLRRDEYAAQVQSRIDQRLLELNRARRILINQIEGHEAIGRGLMKKLQVINQVIEKLKREVRS